MPPTPLRYRCLYDARLTSQVLRRFLRALFAELRRRARRHWRLPRGQCGAVTFVQRFGSALNANLHFHTLALDGVYATDDRAPMRFLPLPPPSTDEVSRVLAGTARRIARLLESHVEEDDDPLAQDEPLLATLAAASLRTRIASGPHAGERWRRLGDRVEPEQADTDPEAAPRVPQHAGMSLHADVAVPAHDRRRLERLCHYAARPPLASERLFEQPDGRLALRLKTCWRDGTTHILMERHELLERLVPLIPPPRAHQVRYHGVLAPCASTRDRVVPGPRLLRGAVLGERATEKPGAESIPASAGMPLVDPQRFVRAQPLIEGSHGLAGSPLGPGSEQTDPAARRASEAPPRPDDRIAPAAAGARSRRLSWAELLQRVFATDGLRCECGARMRLVAAIEDPDVARKILKCLNLPARAPPLAPAVPQRFAWHDHEFADEEPAWAVDPTDPDPDGWA